MYCFVLRRRASDDHQGDLFADLYPRTATGDFPLFIWRSRNFVKQGWCVLMTSLGQMNVQSYTFRMQAVDVLKVCFQLASLNRACGKLPLLCGF